MDNKNLLIVALSAALGITTCDMLLNRRSMMQARKRGRRRRKKQRKAPAGRTLAAGQTMVVADILAEVQKRSDLAHFALATRDGIVIKGDPVAGGINGSQSVANAGLMPLFDEVLLNKQVTLQNDSSLVNLLAKQKRLVRKTKKKYAKILLYFEHDGYRFYIVDPYPQRVVRGRGNAAANILKRW